MQQQITQRNWTLYNLSQTSEKLLAMRLISEAVDYLQIPYEYKGNGRPAFGLDDMLKIICIKTFNCFSQRRTMTELRMAHALGYINQVPHFNNIGNYMNDERLVPWLHKLYKALALPLADIESTFAIDSTGFSSFRKRAWVDYRLEHRLQKEWKKLHIVVGVMSTVVASAEISEGRRSDQKLFEPMIRNASEQFKILEVCADGGYLSRKNCEVVREIGGTPYISPRKDTRTMFIQKYRRGVAWANMIKMWRDKRELFLQHYHQRSNVESAFSSIKRKFLPYVRSKTDIAQENELLCKIVCHNASVLCNAMFVLKVSPDFRR